LSHLKSIESENDIKTSQLGTSPQSIDSSNDPSSNLYNNSMTNDTCNEEDVKSSVFHVDYTERGTVESERLQAQAQNVATKRKTPLISQSSSSCDISPISSYWESMSATDDFTSEDADMLLKALSD
jgi:hypothetical protein